VKKRIHRAIKKLLGFKPSESDARVLRASKRATSIFCKPCWELRYCPYGPLVENFPLLPPTRAAAIEHNEYLKRCLETGTIGDGTKRLDANRRAWFKQEVRRFRPSDYPEEIPEEIAAMQCTVFGHICPVVYTAEGFTETSEGRRTGRYIPFRTKMRVVRRDNYTCQHCTKHLQDPEVEFDHIIPLSKGGSSDEHNIRLTCHDCNHDKSDRVDI
jgi:hypothetical protein